MSDFKPYEQAANAIKCINGLPEYKQAPRERRGRMGNEEIGFCCLGASCKILGINFDAKDATSWELVNKIGLNGSLGEFQGGKEYFGQHALSSVNDSTKAGFKRIAHLMRTKPDFMFLPEVAKLISAYYKEKHKINY